MGGGGYFTLGRWGAAPIRAHWTVPLFAWWFGRGSIVSWAAIAVLILIHELGHGLVVRFSGHRVVGIYLTGFGGVCEWYGPATALEEAAIAWGGLWAQGLVYLATELWLVLHGPPDSAEGWALTHAFTESNLWMAMFNLLPVEPLDGARAWPFFSLLWRRWRGPRAGGTVSGRTDTRPAWAAPASSPKPAATSVSPAEDHRGEPREDEDEAARREAQFQKILGDIYAVPRLPPEEDDEP